ELSPGRVREEVRAGRADRLFDRESADPHWVEAVIERGNGLRDSGHKAYRVFIGATGSMHRTLFDEAGGMDPAMVLGGDSELGYRLAQRGALFVPDLDTSSWHLGRSQMQTRRDAGTRYRSPHIANRVPDYHLRRKSPERIWEVPRADVVVQAGGFSLEEVEATAARVLAGTAPDIRLWLVGPWSGIGDGRCSPLEEECLDLRLIREAFRGDPRVRFSEEVPEEDPQVPFRLYVPTGSLPLRGMVADLVKLADADGAGLVCVPVPGATREGDGVLRMERAAAFARARHLEPGAGGGDLDRVVEAVSGIRWASAQDIVDVPEGADTTWSAVRAGAVRRRAGADLSPAELRRELARAQAEVARLKHKVERTERKLRWFTPGLTRRVLRRIAR
ncbi:glycosyltransferase family 2 protein, partial [Nocardiopsis algeriensis]|uniref:glycosyltransferase family 2 protein n=1 Tax=Nocardiopsis algeriensis TaxID=1478215 RepID=UPI001C86870B